MCGSSFVERTQPKVIAKTVDQTAKKPKSGCLQMALVLVALAFMGIVVLAAYELSLTTTTSKSKNVSQSSVPTQSASHREVVLNLSGSGATTTRKFNVSDDWDLVWSYDCSKTGDKGNFQIFISAGKDKWDTEAGVNELGMKGDSTDHLHGGSGERYLTINAVCDWTVQAIRF